MLTTIARRSYVYTRGARNSPKPSSVLHTPLRSTAFRTRLFTTSTGKPTNGIGYAHLAVGCTLSGILGYFLANAIRQEEQDLPLVLSTLQHKYGSPDDFKRAIEVLNAVFADAPGTVSTNPDILSQHGMSDNLQNPGK